MGLAHVALLDGCSDQTANTGSSNGSSGTGVDSGENDRDSGRALDDSGIYDPDAGPIAPTTAVRVIVQPSDKGAALLAAIRNAKTSVHMTMYLVTDADITNALIAQNNAGRDVKVVLNQQFPSAGDNNITPYNALKNAGVDVVWAPPSFTYTHQKTFVFDATEAWIMTMNMTYSSADTNREFMIIDTDPADVAETEAIFVADRARQPFTNPKRLVLSPISARSRINALALSAKKSIDIHAAALSDYATVTTLMNMQKAGVTVRCVVDGSAAQQAAMGAAIGRIKSAGGVVKTMKTLDSHAKSMIVDGTTAFVGSQNYTKTSLDENRELGVILDEPSTVRTLKATFDTDFATGNPI